MANIKSQKKRILTNERARQRNIAVRSRMRTLIKQVREAIEEKNVEALKTVLPAALSVIDRAATKGVIHPRAASRKKSHLQQHAANI